MKKRQEVMITKKGSHNNNKRSARKSQAVVRYVECQRNHAAYIRGHAVDGCREFIAAAVGGKDLTNVEAELSCAACGCHRNFHRREVVEITSEVVPDSYSSPSNNSTLY
ncbi:hypothetical protein ABFS82_04G157600 [Erythranthe guttata]|uniref:ZF-HD dimerization-type domain-containing protein n=1 Tax=Erythranthe guttata TaxID=4155 RepID=A0A022Q9T8_ERYGU|nr:PREDICTED: mini zinc finger protein 3 [Erythranthe guttata]EYU24374.1 hypothetical protein MIMGU_mgv1a024106mg [Erythranthe guttata]|eukprot:XP_012852957.1 PREDICTED: mini zinc finger protein 3 [Erythranthe guttata]